MAKTPWTSNNGKGPRPRPTLHDSRHRSGLEERIAKQIETAGVVYTYEGKRFQYEVPASLHHYTPDFHLGDPPKIIIESKGYFPDASERKKLILVRDQYPNMDLRLVFQDANKKISKTSKTSYADWAIKNGFKWADHGRIPEVWLMEVSNV